MGRDAGSRTCRPLPSPRWHRADGSRGRTGDQRRRRELDLVLLGRAGALDEADRRERDVDQVELIGEGLDHAPEPVEPVAQEGLAQVRPHDLGPALAQVGDGRDVGDLELRSRGRLDVAKKAVLARFDQRDGHALATGPARPSDPMDIGVGVGWDVVVDDVRDVLDIETAGRHVGRDEHVQRAVTEAAHHPVACLLDEAAVERTRVMAARAQGLAPDRRPRPRVRAKTSVEVGSSTSRIRHSAASLSVRRTTYATCLTRGAPPPGACSAWTVIRAGSRRCRLAIRVIVVEMVAENSAVWRSIRRGGEDRLEVLGEAHVEHLVRLVEHDDPDLVEAQAAALQMVDRPARRRDHDVDTATKAAQLLADRLPAVDRQDPGAQLAAIRVERLGDLHRELTRRDEDQGGGAAFAGGPELDALEHRQCEGRGLAGSRRGLREEVSAGQQRRDGLALDRRRFLVAEGRDRVQQAGVELEPAEAIVGDGIRLFHDRSGRRRRTIARPLHGWGWPGQRAPTTGSRSIVRTERVPPPSVRTVAAGMTPAMSRTMTASSPA